MNCEGCGADIPDGMHFMKIKLELHTAGEERWASVDAFTTLDVTVHHPGCFALWASKNPIIVDVFADTGRH